MSTATIGEPAPLGATVGHGGVNFSLFSRTATGVDLLFFDRESDAKPSRAVVLDPVANRSYHYWHTFVPEVKPGQLYGYHILNTTVAVAYVQVFNVASGSVTLGTTAPTFVLGIPASGGATFNNDIGIAMGTAISVAATTTRNGSTTAACEVTMFYK